MALSAGYTASLIQGGDKFTIDPDGTLHPIAGELAGLGGTSVTVQARVTRDSDGQHVDLDAADVTITEASLLLPFNALAIGEGDSIMAQTDARSIMLWLSLALAGRLDFSANDVYGTEGQGGDKWADIAGDAAALLSEHDPDLILLDGGTNDTNVTVPFSAALASADSAIDTLTSGGTGALVWYMQIPLRTDVNAPFKATDEAANDAHMLGLASSNSRLRIYDSSGSGYDPDDASQSLDKLHPKSAGAKLIGEDWAADISPYLGTGDVWSVLGANLLTNGDFAGAGGSKATGIEVASTVPTGWTADNDAGVTCLVQTGSDGEGNYVDLVITGAATTASQDVRLYQTVTTAIAIGDAFDGAVHIELSGSDGTGDPVGLQGWEWSGGKATIGSRYNPAASGHMSYALDTVARCFSQANTASGSSTQAGFFSRWNVGAVDARIRMRRGHLSRRV